MILDIFHELQLAKPWPPDHERLLFEQTLEQAKLADELGFGCWWTVEHHGAVEFSYSSAPEVVVAALAQHTERLRFGHSGVLAPFAINHPVRVAERAAVTDILSGGRLELGLARSGGTEWETFGIDPESSRDQLREALQMIPAMWTQERFSWDSPLLTVPEREIVPKPLQKPHPPLWQTCTSPESFAMAGELGVGALATTLLSPLSSLCELFDAYGGGLANCRPAGEFVNDQRAVFTFMHCGSSELEVVRSGAAEAALWFVNAAPRVFRAPRDLWLGAIRGALQDDAPAASAAVADPHVDISPEDDLDDPLPVIRLLNRQQAGLPIDPEEAYEVVSGIESVVLGDVDQCRRKLAHFKEIGVDRLMCLMSFGALGQPAVLRSMRLTGEYLIDAV